MSLLLKSTAIAFVTTLSITSTDNLELSTQSKEIEYVYEDYENIYKDDDGYWYGVISVINENDTNRISTHYKSGTVTHYTSYWSADFEFSRDLKQLVDTKFSITTRDCDYSFLGFITWGIARGCEPTRRRGVSGISAVILEDISDFPTIKDDYIKPYGSYKVTTDATTFSSYTSFDKNYIYQVSSNKFRFVTSYLYSPVEYSALLGNPGSINNNELTLELLEFTFILEDYEIDELKDIIKEQLDKKVLAIESNTELTDYEKQKKLNLLKEEYVKYDLNYDEEMKSYCEGSCIRYGLLAEDYNRTSILIVIAIVLFIIYNPYILQILGSILPLILNPISKVVTKYGVLFIKVNLILLPIEFILKKLSIICRGISYIYIDTIEIAITTIFKYFGVVTSAVLDFFALIMNIISTF